jgi:hypothetical protein
MTLKDLLLDELKQIYPDMKDYLADRYVTKYVSAVLAEVKQALLRPENDNDELSFSTRNLRDCGRVDYAGKKEYLFWFMNKSAKTRLVTVPFRGNTGKMSRVVLNELYKDQIMNELLNTPPAKMTASDRTELEANYNRVIPIDVASLQGYITSTRDSIGLHNSGSPMHEKLTNNYTQATTLLAEVEHTDGIDYVKEYWITADTGRTYGKFTSLQRMDKNVRHAALGVCHKYDFQAHSFAVMASIAKSIDPTIKIAAIEDYIRYRSTIRKQIAEEVGVPESVIKTVFTSLGFGAQPIANPYNSIRKEFYTEEKYLKFINNQTFQFIREDLEKINAAVLAYPHYAQEDFEGFDGFKFTGRDAETNRKKNNSKRLAWIYQNAESSITNEFVRIVEARSGMTPLMTVHDCAYYKQRIPTETFLDVQTTLRMDHDFEFVKLEHEAIFPITTQAVYESRFREQDLAEEQHRQSIANEERKALGHVSEWNRPFTNSRVVINPFKALTREEDLPDYEYNFDLDDYRK